MIDFKNCPKEEVWELCGPNGERRILKNETELTFARMIIARDALEGYYVRRPYQVGVWGINKYGVIESRDGYPYEEHEKMSAKIIRFAMMTRSKELVVDFDEE